MIIESPFALPDAFFFIPMFEHSPRKNRADHSAQAANSMKDPRRKGEIAKSRYTRSMRATPVVGLLFAVLLAFSSARADGGWSERSSSHFQLFEAVGFARYSGPDGSR